MVEDKPFVKCEGSLFNHIWLLTQYSGHFSNPQYIREFAEISNFLWKGTSFHFIENIKDYQRYYLEQIEKENHCPLDLFPYRLTDYQIFDVRCMHEPRVIEGMLYYYVFQDATRLPYKVSCTFPYISTSTVVRYQILPY